jgi:hypothetical protein
VLEQDDADAAGLQRQAGLSRPRMMDRERRVQMRGRVGHAETRRPDQPHAVAAADAQQLGPGCAVQARRDHHQGLDPPPSALFGDSDDGSRRGGDDRQVDRLGQCRNRWRAGDAV